MSEDGEYDESVDNKNYKAISCEQIPELFLDKIVAKQHFSKFGKIKRFILRPKRLSCTVEYEKREDAERALMESGNFNGTEFIVNFAENEVAHVQNTEEWVDPEVQAELDAMSTPNRGLRTPSAVPAHSLQKPVNRQTKSTIFLPQCPRTTKSLTASRVDSPQPDISKIDTTQRMELENVLKRPAYTDEEKYRVLDARDKLIRLTSIRQTDIKKAVATKGTCPDMCPEKERLMREYQRQVSIFEMADDSEAAESAISHRKAVKEYSRSSADQEVPLSHELRPESVLQMTMLYLMHRIMDLCDDPKTSLGDWFHFVWDRTRSIRKDITQQELCSLGAVELVEQCARFHIHCAARLVAEDPSVFDKKINAENLTKCLQTLKYMYHDLRIKGIHCPCEAEFRSYIILLNLRDSNFLWEVKQLPECIQRNNEIKRAIGFYNALQNNNYVKFFDMIKSEKTSYLSACILLCYFTKLRVHAMEAIIKSHNWRKNDVYLPLSYLTRILGFDDEESAVNFFNYYGLQCDVQDNRVLLDRLSKPDTEYAMDRALQLVESKRQVSVGECIYGQKLPPASLFENHQPHSSFDQNGMLKLESWSANDQLQDDAGKASISRNNADLDDLRNASEENVFKIPKVSDYVSSKQKHETYKKEVQIYNKNQENTFSFASEQQENCANSSSGGFRFGGNIFGKSKPTIHFTSDNIFSSSTANFPPSENTSNSIKHKTKIDNIFGSTSTVEQSNANNIFGVAAKETANIFQQFKNSHQISDYNIQNNLMQSSIPIKSLATVSYDPNTKNNNIVKGEIIEDELKFEEEVIKYKKIKEDRKKFQELEEKNLRENELLQKDLELQLKKQRINDLKIKLYEKCEHETSEIISNFVSEEVFKIAQSEVLICQTIEDAASLQSESLISEAVCECVKDIAHEEYALICYDQLLLNRYFNRWLLLVRKKKEQKKLMDDTPLWITTASRLQYVQALEHPCKNKNLEMLKRYRLGEPSDLNELLKKKETNILYEENENPLNLFALVGQHLLNKPQLTSCGLTQQRRYFKFLIALPSDDEESLGFGTFLNKWLIKYIQKANAGNGPFLHGLEHNMALCVRKLSGIIPKNEIGNKMTTEGDHNDGIVFFISGMNVRNQSRNRLYNLVKRTKNQKRVPLAIIVYNCTYSKEELIEMLDLNLLQEKGLIYSYILLGVRKRKKDFSFRNKLIEAVNFITEESYSLNIDELQALAMQNILSFLEASLGEEMWIRWSESAQINPVFNKISTIPTHVIGIYHKALDHLLHITQEDFTDMPEFPEELKEFVPKNIYNNLPLGLEYFPINWKDKARTDVIKKFLQNLFLPEIKEKVPTDIDELNLWLLNYATQCLNADDLTVTKSVYEAITNLINQINSQHSEDISISLRLNMINYFNVFKSIVFAHINCTLKHYSKDMINLFIVYLRDNFENYITQPWWLNYQPLNSITLNNAEDSIALANHSEQSDNENAILVDSIDSIIEKAESTSKIAEARLLEFRRKNNYLKNTSDPLGRSSQIRRTLDGSFYQFQLSKKIGEYDNTFITRLTEDIDKTIEEVLSQSSLVNRKRKRLKSKSSAQCSGIDEIITKAGDLIKKLDSNEDHKYKIKKLREYVSGD